MGRRPAECSTKSARRSLSAPSHEERPPDVWIPGANGALSRRERDCLTHLELGLSSSETAAALGVSRSTLNAHLASARQKLGARNTSQALLIFAKLRAGDRQSRIRLDCEASLTESQISLVDRLSQCDSFIDAWLALHDYTAAFGIRAISFWIVADPCLVIDDGTGAMWSSLPEENLRLYREMGGMTADPLGPQIVRATVPFNIDPERFHRRLDGMPVSVRRMATAMVEAHMNRVMSVNYRDPATGAATGCVFTFDYVRDYHEFERLVAATGEELTRTTALFWDHVQRAKLLAEAPGLSRRQRETLVLLARGYSLTQAAGELHVSVRAAEKLAAAARSKLGARTSAQAVYRAMVYRALV